VFQTHDDDLANEANDILFAARLSLASFLHVSTLSWHGPWGPLLMERARARRSRLHWSRSGKRGIGASRIGPSPTERAPVTDALSMSAIPKVT